MDDQRMKIEIVLKPNKTRAADLNDGGGRVLGTGHISLQRVLLAEQFTLQETVSLMGTFPMSRQRSGSRKDAAGSSSNKKVNDVFARRGLAGAREHLAASAKVTIALQRQNFSLCPLQVTEDLLLGS